MIIFINISFKVNKALLIILFFFNNNPSDCVHPIIDKEYKNSIHHLDCWFLKGVKLDTGTTSKQCEKAFIFLEKLTGIKSNHTYKYSGMTYKGTGTSYKKERKKWNNWFRINKCNISVARVDSLISLINHLNSTYGVTTGNEF